jgi:hypothetical protein
MRKHPNDNEAIRSQTASDQTRGQLERDPKGRTGHFTGAGDPAIKQEMGRKSRKRATPRRGGQ